MEFKIHPKWLEQFELDLEDRLAKIRAINEQYDLEHNGYISFSGGKDSRVLSEVFDLALPNNNIPRVFINTGVEYSSIRKFVQELSLKDKRVQIINANVNIKNMLNNYGYPFKSKQHAHNWWLYYNNNNELDSTIKQLTEHPELQRDYNYIHNLPKGIKTNIKYIFGLREKTTKIEISDKPINEYSEMYDNWGMKDYQTHFGIIEKETRNSVVERERAV